MKSGLSVADYSAGLMAALGMLAAIFEAQRTGRGRDVDVSLYDVALAFHNYRATWYLTTGLRGERTPNSSHPSIVPFQFFPTSDGYLAVACAKEKFFRALVDGIDLGELGSDPRFANFEGRRRHREELTRILEERLREQPTNYWVKLLRGRVPVAPVRSMEAALERDELERRGMLATYQHEALGAVTTVGLPIKVSGFAPHYRPGPRLDGDGAALLAEAGYQREEIEALRARGAFGSDPPPPPWLRGYPTRVRSALFTPGTEADRLRKAVGLGADVCIFDLEDSVPPARVAEARTTVAVGDRGVVR